MRRLLVATVAATMAFGTFAFTGAEDLEPHLTDPAGDANFLNGQGFATGLSASGPMQVPGGDLQAITFESVFKGPSLESLKVHVTLDQPLDAGSPDMVYRVTGNINGCPMMIAANGEIVDGVSGYLRFTDGAACGYGDDAVTNAATGVADFTEGVTVESTDFGFTVTLDAKGLPKFAQNHVKPGKLISEIDAHVRTILVAATAPVVDELFGDEFEGYKIGS